MQPPRQRSRFDLAELKAQMVTKLGPEGSEQYFHYLNSFLSLRLNKSEFHNLCRKILGRDSIPLHNQLVRSILKNACTAKSPPPPRDDDTRISHVSVPPSPKKIRTCLRDQRDGDRRSPVGPNGKASIAPRTSDFDAALENGDLVFLHQTENKNEILIPNAANLSVGRRCSNFSPPPRSEGGPDSVIRDEEKDSLPKSPIRAPLGIPFCSASAGGPHRDPSGSGRYPRRAVFYDCILLDNVNLRERMEEIASSQGLQGVSLDSANLLNHGLDSYMKRLISSCIELVGSTQGSELTNTTTTNNNDDDNNNRRTNKRHGYGKLVNGVKLPVYQNRVQEQRNRVLPISLRDFRVSMEMNPRKLGEDWPLLLENISMKPFG